MQEEMARMPKGTYIKLMFQFVKDGILITTTDTKYYQMENLKKKTIYIKGSLQMLNIKQFLAKIFVIVY